MWANGSHTLGGLSLPIPEASGEVLWIELPLPPKICRSPILQHLRMGPYLVFKKVIKLK